MNLQATGACSIFSNLAGRGFREESYARHSDMRWVRRMLETAIENDEFELVYQPQADTCGQKIVGVEALLRWHSAEHGTIAPCDFIPVAEKLELISDIGDMVINKASAQLHQWKQNYGTHLRMAVNVSYMQVHSHRVIDTLDACMRRYQLQAGDLEVEMTESSLVEDKRFVIMILNEMKEMGVRTAIDDFGTGYSSLNHLARMPFDLLKIDKSFIAELGQNRATTTITESIISMAKKLGMDVLAEGVETPQQLKHLGVSECDLIQGNFICQPVSPAQIPVMTGMTVS